MKILLDTHMLIWWGQGNPALPHVIRDAISSAEQRVVVSLVSLWEISVKRGMGKLRFDVNFHSLFMAGGFERLDLTISHLIRHENLPHHHRDPFDRLLIAQALDEGMMLASSDAKIALYDVPLLT